MLYRIIGNGLIFSKKPSNKSHAFHHLYNSNVDYIFIIEKFFFQF